MRRKVGDEYQYTIHEFYLDIAGSGPGWSPDLSPQGDTLQELQEDYVYMGSAFSKPVLDYETGREI